MADDPRDERHRRGEDEDDERWSDGLRDISDSLRKRLRSSLRGLLSEDGLRQVVADAVPKELLRYLMGQIDAGKDEVVRIVGVQVRKFLENLDIGGELQKVLTSVSFEIRTEVRFIPNDQSVQSVRPEGKVRVKIKRGEETEEVKPTGARVAALRRGVRGAVDSVISALHTDEAADKTRMGAIRDGLLAAVDAALAGFAREEEAEDEEAGDAAPAPSPAGAPGEAAEGGAQPEADAGAASDDDDDIIEAERTD
jgi:hypothetical protein